MQILEIRPEPPGRSSTVARFDVQLDGLRLFNLALKRGPNGYRVFAPSAFGCAAATFTHEIAGALIDAALGEIADEHRAG